MRGDGENGDIVVELAGVAGQVGVEEVDDLGGARRGPAGEAVPEPVEQRTEGAGGIAGLDQSVGAQQEDVAGGEAVGRWSARALRPRGRAGGPVRVLTSPPEIRTGSTCPWLTIVRRSATASYSTRAAVANSRRAYVRPMGTEAERRAKATRRARRGHPGAGHTEAPTHPECPCHLESITDAGTPPRVAVGSRWRPGRR